jgi:hypothetical protein
MAPHVPAHTVDVLAALSLLAQEGDAAALCKARTGNRPLKFDDAENGVLIYNTKPARPALHDLAAAFNADIYLLEGKWFVNLGSFAGTDFSIKEFRW